MLLFFFQLFFLFLHLASNSNRAKPLVQQTQNYEEDYETDDVEPIMEQPQFPVAPPYWPNPLGPRLGTQTHQIYDQQYETPPTAPILSMRNYATQDHQQQFDDYQMYPQCMAQYGQGQNHGQWTANSSNSTSAYCRQ